ncbi:MAG: carboxysome shell carbonic anhydrase [Candidatus Thiodiazotropha taylori]|uniref:Carboxysome shell carbonic anhydrase n=1 Tax=Candidatus Thiodiazotropha taylori TaxID=2792791 RepID=A0A9E4T7R7_9GAMM|nr:carboxysome shell carbonic anhydrase [Candidatus Thiodiazotropha taylori]MCG7962779.1 carboxysome shell carbonic anhydrase [Candidatus Thiodiazotropha endolucinida]MCG7966647.1 carboxysome shell carbonic anhydrase [Candidatus Thiodiazotropha taylori]MCG8028376.1 carboxysome shell carbonic anhydrase [Candidatus Thiodiazotropha taylori]MCG8082004.1 carboxysome shell carbonic anhydrase [Candidatus Thiodiazotropha taylori]
MDIHNKPIEERIDWLFNHAHNHSCNYTNPENWLARTRYLAEHPTAIAVLKCMDGRINIPIATNTPKGIIQPFRNLGGMFDLGWPHLGEVLASYVQNIISEGRHTMILITYHFSKGDPSRGCAGFNYDTDAARAHTFEIKRQVEAVFGGGHQTVYPIVCGFETDEDALILHGSNGELLNMADIKPFERDTLRPRLEALFPDMSKQMCEDLLPLIAGNLDHIEAARQVDRELNIEHREWMICIGRGFDFLHMPNIALIIGPYSPSLADPIHKAAGIIESNMKAGRIPDDGFLLFASVPFQDVGVDQARAKMKSNFLCEFAANEIRQSNPQLAEKMHVKSAVLNWQSRALEILNGQH